MTTVEIANQLLKLFGQPSVDEEFIGQIKCLNDLCILLYGPNEKVSIANSKAKNIYCNWGQNTERPNTVLIELTIDESTYDNVIHISISSAFDEIQIQIESTYKYSNDMGLASEFHWDTAGKILRFGNVSHQLSAFRENILRKQLELFELILTEIPVLRDMINRSIFNETYSRIPNYLQSADQLDLIGT